MTCEIVICEIVQPAQISIHVSTCAQSALTLGS